MRTLPRLDDPHGYGDADQHDGRERRCAGQDHAQHRGDDGIKPPVILVVKEGPAVGVVSTREAPAPVFSVLFANAIGPAYDGEIRVDNALFSDWTAHARKLCQIALQCNPEGRPAPKGMGPPETG